MNHIEGIANLKASVTARERVTDLDSIGAR